MVSSLLKFKKKVQKWIHLFPYIFAVKIKEREKNLQTSNRFIKVLNVVFTFQDLCSFYFSALSQWFRRFYFFMDLEKHFEFFFTGIDTFLQNILEAPFSKMLDKLLIFIWKVLVRYTVILYMCICIQKCVYVSVDRF